MVLLDPHHHTDFLHGHMPATHHPDNLHMCSGIGGDDSVSVTVGPGNVRSLYLRQFPQFVQSYIRCKGDPPEQLIQGRCDDPAVIAALRCKKAIPEPDLLRSAWIYDKLLAKLDHTCRGKPSKILMLGLGGGTLQTHLEDMCPESEVITVENNPSVVAAARDFFGFTGHVIVDDAQHALSDLAKHGKQYDAVVVDITDARLSRTDTKHLAQVVKPGGQVLENWTAREEAIPRLHDHQKDLRDFFGDVKHAMEPSKVKKTKEKNMLVSVSRPASLHGRVPDVLPDYASYF